MRIKAQWIFAFAFALALVISTAALAGPLRGKTYQGQSASTGTNSAGHQVPLHPSGGPISLAVSSNGKNVTVHFPSHYAIIYCVTSEQLYGQTTKSTRIASNGTFRATVAERFSAGSGPAAITQVVTGKFSGRTVKGTIRTEAPPCGGSTSFSATAR